MTILTKTDRAYKLGILILSFWSLVLYKFFFYFLSSILCSNKERPSWKRGRGGKGVRMSSADEPSKTHYERTSFTPQNDNQLRQN